MLLGGGMAGILLAAPWRPASLAGLLPVGLLRYRLLASTTPFTDRGLRLGLFFLKVGVLLFGSGMILFAFIQRDVVERYGWLTPQQLMDAIAVGQMTPGPVVFSATFIGYLVAGWARAAVATLRIFSPLFVIVALVGPWIPRLRRSTTAQAFLRGVNAAAIALIPGVAIALKIAFLPSRVHLWWRA